MQTHHRNYIVRALENGNGYVIDHCHLDGRAEQLIGVYRSRSFALRAIERHAHIRPDVPRIQSRQSAPSDPVISL